MNSYVAMLRGINVSGQKIIKMEKLRASMEPLGFSQVKTYVQSGNIVFQAAPNSEAAISRKIAERIEREFGFAVPVFVKSARDLARIVKENPFPEDESIDQSKLHVTFLSGAAPPTAAQSLAALAVKPGRFHVSAHEIYLYCPNGYGETKLSNTAIEKKLAVGATTRNWKSVNTLLAMAQA
jgi:uncharacterized protein (DUF1697 family)